MSDEYSATRRIIGETPTVAVGAVVKLSDMNTHGGLLLVSDANLLPRAPSRRARGRSNDNARPEFGIAAIAVLPRCLPAALWGHLDGNVWQTLPIGLPRSAHMPKRGHLPGDGLQAATLKGPVRFQQ